MRLIALIIPVLLTITEPAMAELSDGLKKSLEASLATHKEECDTAKEVLLKAFDTEIAQVRGEKGSAETRLQLIEALEVEKKTFESKGHLPFSPRMRPAIADYLKRVAVSGGRVAKVYDQAITALTKSKDDQAAAAMIREKDQVPQEVGKWLCTIKQSNGRIEHFKFTLYSDFSVNRFADDKGTHPKSWEFKKDKIVITNVTASSPKGGFKDTCTIHPDGQKFDAKNQLGGVFTGKRID